MSALRSHAIFALCLQLLMAGDAGAQFSPTVYEDEHLRVRAGIVEAGLQTLHIGDAMTLEIEVSFDADAVRVEELSDESVRQAFASTPAVRLYRTGPAGSRTDSGNRVNVSRRWQLQVLDCPAEMPSCPQSLSYDLPSIALSYRLVGAEGNPSADTRAARFRPWPGVIDLTPSLPIGAAPIQGLREIIPGGANVTPLKLNSSFAGGGLLFAIAIGLICAGVLATGQRQQKPVRRISARAPVTRWERAFLSLDDANVPDEEWADRLRRCFTWYCVDELHVNPYAMLDSVGIRPSEGVAVEARYRQFFLDLLDTAAIAEEQRAAYRHKLNELMAGSAPAPAGSQAP